MRSSKIITFYDSFSYPISKHDQMRSSKIITFYDSFSFIVSLMPLLSVSYDILCKVRETHSGKAMIFHLGSISKLNYFIFSCHFCPLLI